MAEAAEADFDGGSNCVVGPRGLRSMASLRFKETLIDSLSAKVFEMEMVR
jgi:hypothetical protein